MSKQARHRALGLEDAEALDLHYAMLVTRELSVRALTLAQQGTIDLSIPSDGHEAAQVASMRALRKTDPAYLFYRSVPAAYARGMTARELLMDHFGRAKAPSSGGKNIPGHWSKRALNLMSISGSVATHIPHAVGSALAATLRGEQSVAIAYFGDGGVSKADFHEGLNFAAIHKLPVILFCENNGLAISVPFELQSSVPRVADRAAGYGVPGVTVDGWDPLAVYEVTRAAVERARNGEGPTLIEAVVARLSRHTSQVGDERSEAEMAAARERDPIPFFGRYLSEQGLLDDAEERVLAERAKAEVDEAIEFAREAPAPYAEDAYQTVCATPVSGRMPFRSRFPLRPEWAAR